MAATRRRARMGFLWSCYAGLVLGGLSCATLGVRAEGIRAPSPLDRWDDALKTLKPRCILLDAAGNKVDENDCTLALGECRTNAFGESLTPSCGVPKKPSLKVTALCQPEVVVPVPEAPGDIARVSVSLTLPSPARRYLSKEGAAYLFPKEKQIWPIHGDSPWTGPPKVFTLPPRSELSLLTGWPTGEECNLAVAEIVDAGGVLSRGTLVIVPADLLVADAPVYLPTPSESVATEARRQSNLAAAQQEEDRRTSAQETKSGKCSPERNAQLQGVLAQMKPIMEGSDLYYSAHAIGAAGSPPWSGRTGLSGDYHVFAIGYAGLGLDVRGRDGQPAALSSMYERVAQVASGGVVASKVLQANALEPFTVRVTGQGCALMAIFRAR